MTAYLAVYQIIAMTKILKLHWEHELHKFDGTLIKCNAAAASSDIPPKICLSCNEHRPPVVFKVGCK